MTNKLLQYLTENGIGHNFFAKKIKSSPPTMNRILRKGSIPSLKLAIAIENQTKGEVTVYDWFLCSEQKQDTTKKSNKKKNSKQK